MVKITLKPIHEAIHAAAAVHVGAFFTEVSIVEDEQTAGRLLMDQDAIDALPPADAAFIAMAGCMAEAHLLNRDEVELNECDSWQTARARDRAPEAERETFVDVVSDRVLAFIQSHFPIIERISKALCDARTLSHQQVLDIVELE